MWIKNKNILNFKILKMQRQCEKVLDNIKHETIIRAGITCKKSLL